MAGELAPAVGRHLAIARVQPNDDMSAKRGAGVLQKTGVLDGCGTNDDVAQTSVQITLDRVQIADTATQLHINLATHLFQDLANCGLIFGMPGKGTVQIHQVQTPCPLVDPLAGHDRRVFAEGGGLVHIALFEANAVAVFEIDRRN